MRRRLLAFVSRLRAQGIDVSVAETLDAVAAVAATGVERALLRDGLAATLVKDEADRPAFDRLFDEMFPLGGGAPARTRRRQRPGAAGDWAEKSGGTGDPRGHGARAVQVRSVDPTAPAVAQRHGLPNRPPERERAPVPTRRARASTLLVLPFDAFTSRDVAEAKELVEVLGRRLRGRLARRQRRERRGRLDLRRTLRAAVSTAGVPAALRFRGRRPGRADLVALCDLSGSVSAASELCLGLLAPAAEHFRRVHLFAYVDRLCPVSIEEGHVAPGGPLDLHARSDLGRVLEDLWCDHQALLTRSTLLLVLGDARNNRRPPRIDLLRRVRERVQRLVWLVPEPRVRWDTGDSVLGRYTSVCDAVLESTDLAALRGALARVL